MEVRKWYSYSLTFHFECKMCGTTSCISTENENENPYLPINQAIINGYWYVFFGSFVYK